VNPKKGKGSPKLQNKVKIKGGVSQDNPLNPQSNNNAAKLKMNMGEWCEFHKISTHNTSECRTKKSLVAELKASKSYACSYFESEPKKGNDKGKYIIDAEPNATMATMKI